VKAAVHPPPKVYRPETRPAGHPARGDRPVEDGDVR
jgi:hypothetical protein